MGNLQEAVELLSAGGVIERIKEDVQAEREAERAALLAQLAQVEQDEAKRAATVEKVKPVLLKKFAELKAELAATERELKALEGIPSFTIENTRGKLRRLSDPRIWQAITQLRDLESKARDAFRHGTRRVKRLAGGHDVFTESNALEVADVVAEIRAAMGELEALAEAARPDDLAALLAAKIEQAKQSVGKLGGSRS